MSHLCLPYRTAEWNEGIAALKRQCSRGYFQRFNFVSLYINSVRDNLKFYAKSRLGTSQRSSFSFGGSFPILFTTYLILLI